MSENRRYPNILITGTPGTGKTELSTRIANLTGMRHLNIGKVAEQHSCYDGEDADLDCKVLDEDKVIDAIQSDMLKGNNIVDYHGSDFFEEDWIDIVFCLRSDIETLSKRLEERGYSEVKTKNNIESEIFQVLLEEARDSYAHEIVHELKSNTLEDLESNVERIVSWSKSWISDNSSDVDR